MIPERWWELKGKEDAAKEKLLDLRRSPSPGGGSIKRALLNPRLLRSGKGGTRKKGKIGQRLRGGFWRNQMAVGGGNSKTPTCNEKRMVAQRRMNQVKRRGTTFFATCEPGAREGKVKGGKKNAEHDREA